MIPGWLWSHGNPCVSASQMLTLQAYTTSLGKLHFLERIGPRCCWGPYESQVIVMESLQRRGVRLGLERLLQLVGSPVVHLECQGIPCSLYPFSSGSACHTDLIAFDTGTNTVLAQVTRQAADTVRSDCSLFLLPIPRHTVHCSPIPGYLFGAN